MKGIDYSCILKIVSIILDFQRIQRTRGQTCPEVKVCDEGVKNRFKWSWLQETVQVEGTAVLLNFFCKKIRNQARLFAMYTTAD